MLHPQPSSLFRDGWRDEAGEYVALPPPPSPLPPPHPKPPQAPSPPRATATAHLGASAARPSRFLLSPLTSKLWPSAFPPCSPEPFPTSSPLIGRDAPPSAPQNDPNPLQPSQPMGATLLCVSAPIPRAGRQAKPLDFIVPRHRPPRRVPPARGGAAAGTGRGGAQREPLDGALRAVPTGGTHRP